MKKEIQGILGGIIQAGDYCANAFVKLFACINFHLRGHFNIYLGHLKHKISGLIVMSFCISPSTSISKAL